jgi:hypothetical protein
MYEVYAPILWGTSQIWMEVKRKSTLQDMLYHGNLEL